MRRKHRWSARALNLMVALALVISLGAVLAPAVAQGTPTLDVTITHPLGQDTFRIGEITTVRANVTATGTVGEHALSATATLSKGTDDCVEIVDATQSVGSGAGTILVGETFEVEWQVRCTGGGNVTFTVTANSSNASPDTATVNVDQSPETTVNVDTYVVEGGSLVPRSGFQQGDVFFVNAAVTNSRCRSIGNDTVPVVANIGFTNANVELAPLELGQASKVVRSDDDTEGTIGSRRGGDVWWRAICTGEGATTIRVNATLGLPTAPSAVLLAEGETDVVQEVEHLLRVEIIEPVWDPDEDDPIERCVSENFVVKALIENIGQTDLTEITATISWTPDLADLAPSTPIPQDYVQTVTSPIGPDGWAEVAWTLHGSGSGEMDVFVEVDALEVDPVIADVPVCLSRQLHPDVAVEILSPADETRIGTGETFMVTARVKNTAGLAAGTDVEVEIDLGSNLELVGGENLRVLGDLAAGASYPEPISWTVRATRTGETRCAEAEGYEIQVGVAYSNEELDSNTDNNDDSAYVTIYPAAYLVVTIGAIEGTMGVGDQFMVPYTVENIGEADAFGVSVTLDATPDGTVRIAEAHGGHTQYIGGIASRGSGDIYEGMFESHCRMVGESMIRITPAGRDECGWYPVPKYDEINTSNEPVEEAQRVKLSGREIDAKFLRDDGVTVKQLEIGALDLEIAKTVDRSAGAAGQVLTFTVTVRNNGPVAASGVTVTDDWMPDGLSGPITASCSLGEDLVVGTNGLTWAVGNLGAHASATLLLAGKLNTGDEMCSMAVVAGDQPDWNADNDMATVCVNASTLLR